MKIIFANKLKTGRTQAIIVPVFQDLLRDGQWASLMDHYPEAKKLVKRYDFKGKTGEAIVYNSSDHGVLIAFLGAGKFGAPGDAAKLAAKITSVLRQHKCRNATIHFVLKKRFKADYWQSFIDFLFIGDYRFDKYMNTSSNKERLGSVHLYCEKSAPIPEEFLSERMVVDWSVTKARDLVNDPPSETNPDHLVQAFQRVAKDCMLDISVCRGDDLKKNGYCGIHAVGAASAYKPALIRLDYTPAEYRESVTLVGKGITFDSGGLNIKPAASMADMKSDMAGAAVVLAVAEAAARLKLPVKIETLAAVAENMPGGYAYRPGDIITFQNNKSVEIVNTDAEGRLLLADALCDASQRKPGCIIEVSTLTGGIARALGEAMAGLMGTNESLMSKLLKSGQAACEPLWQMPMPGDYKESIKSRVADLKNAGYGKASGIKAGLFLAEFTGGVPFAHIDIAGTAFLSKPNGQYPQEGATGFGVRLLLDFLASL